VRFGPPNGHARKQDEQNRQQRHAEKCPVGTAANEVLGDETGRANSAEGAQNANHPRDAAGAKRVNHRDARDKVDPPPFEVLQFARRQIQVDEEVGEENEADQVIDMIENGACRLAERQERLGLECDEHVNSQTEHEQLVRAQLGMQAIILIACRFGRGGGASDLGHQQSFRKDSYDKLA